jgi:tetratricopeptide (TPR) repeat protein
MSTRWRIAVLLALAIVAAPIVRTACAQTAREDIALGDRAYDDRHAKEALQLYQRALSIEPKNYDALCKASRMEIDLAELAPKGVDADSLMLHAEQHADTAIAVRPADAEGHFALARALGRKALTLGVMDRIKFSKVIRNEALEALKYDSLHAGALHVLGMWNAEVMRVNGMARVFAKTFLGGQVFSKASWEEAQRLLEKSVAVDPARLVHHLDLGSIYADRGAKDKAREQFELVIKSPVREFNDPLYKQQAADRLRKL